MRARSGRSPQESARKMTKSWGQAEARPAARDDELTELLAKLVSIESYSGGELTAQRFIADWFRSNRMPADLEPADVGLFNVVAEIKGNGPGPRLWIGGHADTVSP